VNALVQIAGGARGTQRVEDGDPADWTWMYEVNVLATQRMVAALLPLMRASAADDGHADAVFVRATLPPVGAPAGCGAALSVRMSAATRSTMPTRLPFPLPSMTFDDDLRRGPEPPSLSASEAVLAPAPA